MKSLLTILLIFFFFSIFSQERQYKVGIIAFYNLENLFDTINDPDKNDEDFLPTGSYLYTGDVYKDKLGKLSDVLSQIGKDISPDGFSLLGVAEIENRQVLEELVSQPKLSSRNLKIIHYDGPDERSIDCALLYNPKYFKVTSSTPLFVKLQNSDGKLHYTRDILWVTGLYDGELIHVFVNHWPSRRGGEEASAPSRATAAGVCKHVIDSLMKIDVRTKVIIMGDLNDDPSSASIKEVLGAKNKISDVKSGDLYNPWQDFLKKGIGTLAYNDSWNLFDQIILSSAFLEKEQSGFFFKKAQIFNRNFLIEQTGKYKGYPMRTYNGNKYNYGYSDHFPTYCVLFKEVKKK